MTPCCVSHLPATTASWCAAGQSRVSLGQEGAWGLWGWAGHGAGGERPDLGLDMAGGVFSPRPVQDEEVLLDGRKVLVCQGKPIPMPTYKHSSFSQSEYIIYQESRCRIRYLVQLLF